MGGLNNFECLGTVCYLSLYTLSFFYSSLYFLLKRIIYTFYCAVNYSELNTVSKLYGSDPCSAHHFLRALLIMQCQNLHVSFWEAHHVVITSATHTIQHHEKNKTKTINVHPEQFFSYSKANTFAYTHTHIQPSPQRCPC